MKKNLIKRSFRIIQLIIVISLPGCIKDTYNMKMLSRQAHLSPTLAISAVKGDISFSDAVKATDTIVFDQNKLVTIIFKKDSIIDLKLSDFTKANIVKTAVIDPGSFDLNIKDFLSHISGDFLFVNPVIKFNYSNSFPDSVKVNLVASGRRGNKIILLNLKPFGLTKPVLPAQQSVNSTFVIDKNNSNLPLLVSLPPEVINYSGNVTLMATSKSGPDNDNASVPTHMVGSIELQVPLELRINNLQFTDTVKNFINDGNSSGNLFKPEDFQLLRVIINAKNGFPLGAAVKMSLYDSKTRTIKSTVDATSVLAAAPVDSDGKVTGVNETSTTVEFTKAFFSSSSIADKIIFRFTLTSTGNGSQNVKIYSDYRINFSAALVVKTDINLQ